MPDIGGHHPAADGPLAPGELRLIDARSRAANYLAVGQIYVMSTRCCGSS